MSTISPLITKPEEMEKEKINQDLYELAQTAGFQMDFQLFSSMVELLRDGIPIETLSSYLNLNYKNTKTWKKFQKLKAKQAQKKHLGN